MRLEVGQTARVFKVINSPYSNGDMNGMFYAEDRDPLLVEKGVECHVGVDLFTGDKGGHFGIDQGRKHAKCVGRLTVRRLHNTDPITII